MNFYCLGAGAPTVILEAGLGGTTMDWRWVQTSIAKRTRVCAYDRAGMGFSDPGPLPRTAEAGVADLTALLKAAAIKPPYVLVGHSLGSFYVRLYADRHLKEVAGMVLVDPSVEYQLTRFLAAGSALSALMHSLEQASRNCSKAATAGTLALESAVFKACTSGSLQRDPAFSDAVHEARTKQALSAGFWAMRASELENLNDASSAELAAARRSYGNMPLIVLTAHNTFDSIPGASAHEAQVLDRILMTMHGELAALSSRGSHRRIENAGHYIQKDRPDVVIDAVDEVVRVARAGVAARMPSCCKPASNSVASAKAAGRAWP